ncbi:hypothetical protein V2G26_015592 [Clonostachys chloroleuca]
MILGILEEIISQLKWTWQRTPRLVRHLSHIYQASRGFWGSILLPARLRAWFSYSYIGCLLVLLSIGVGPFSQQAVGTRICNKPVPNAQAKHPYTYSGIPTSRIGAGNYITKPGFAIAVIGASTGAINVNPSTLLEGCSTGNCPFPSIVGDVSLSTMGICSKCIDTTRYIREWTVNKTTIVGLPELANFTDGTTARSNFFSVKQYSIEWARGDFSEDFISVLAASVDNHTFLAATSDSCEYKNDTSRISKCVPPSSTNILLNISGG